MLVLPALWLLACTGGSQDGTAAAHGQGIPSLPREVALAEAALDSGDFLRAGSLARAAIAHQAGDTTSLAHMVALQTWGTALHMRAQHDSAMPLLSKALLLAEQRADSGRAASIRKVLAMNYEGLGDYPRALRMLMEAMRYQERNGDSTKLANTLLSLGKIYYMQDDDQAARKEFERAVDVYRALGDSSGMSIGLNNVTRVMVEHGEFDTAIVLLRYNIELRKRVMPKRSRAALESNLSSAFVGLQQWDSALVHAQRCLDEATRHKQDDMLALGWLGVARARKGKGELDQALDAAERSMAIAEPLDRPEQVSEAHKVMATILFDKGDHRAAYERMGMHHALEDSLVSEERTKEMLELRTRYDLDQKEWENQRLRDARMLADARASSARWGMAAVGAAAVVIGVLAWMLVQRARHRAHLREMELEQQVLRSQMDPHFLFNALNTIPGLYATGDVATANDHVGHLSKFLRSVLETTRRRTVPLARELDLVEHYLRISANRNPGRFTWNIDVRPYVRTEQIAVPPMLVQPVVENALEHGLRGRDGGHVEVTVDMAGTVLTVSVEDNGIGRQAAAARPSQRNHGSMGIELVRQRIGLYDPRTPAHEAVVVFDKSDGNGAPAGTRVVLRMRAQTLTEHAAAGDRG